MVMRGMLLLAAGVIAGAPWHASELGRSARTSWSTKQTLVYHDSAAFRAAWAQLFPIASMRPALPAVDFTKYRAFIVAAGDRGSGGYRLSLGEGHVVGDTAQITVIEYTPAPGCSYTQDITSPAVAIAAPRAPAGFRIVTQVRPDTVRCR